MQCSIHCYWKWHTLIFKTLPIGFGWGSNLCSMKWSWPQFPLCESKQHGLSPKHEAHVQFAYWKHPWHWLFSEIYLSVVWAVPLGKGQYYARDGSNSSAEQMIAGQCQSLGLDPILLYWCGLREDLIIKWCHVQQAWLKPCGNYIQGTKLLPVEDNICGFQRINALWIRQ